MKSFAIRMAMAAGLTGSVWTEARADPPYLTVGESYPLSGPACRSDDRMFDILFVNLAEGFTASIRLFEDLKTVPVMFGNAPCLELPLAMYRVVAVLTAIKGVEEVDGTRGPMWVIEVERRSTEESFFLALRTPVRNPGI